MSLIAQRHMRAQRCMISLGEAKGNAMHGDALTDVPATACWIGRMYDVVGGMPAGAGATLFGRSGNVWIRGFHT